MIPQVVRGEFMPDLISYLFGPGRDNEHNNQHLVAGYGDAVFSAPDRLWQPEPGVQRQVRDEARELGWQVEYPRARWGTEVVHGYVWHCSLSIKAEEGQLTDEQWTEAAHAMVSTLGFDGTEGKAPCRWVAVRHGLSKEGNDHIHIAVNLVREDGTKASPWQDYRKASAVCADLEERFGLQHVTGRMNGRRLPEASRADREISAARGEPEPLRTRLERKVRACAAAANSEAHFIALARSNGLLIRPRYADDRKAHVVGYAVAEKNGRTAYSNRTKRRGPVWFGGGKLASDLTLPKLRQRWQSDTAEADAEALAAWSTAATLTPSEPSARRGRQIQIEEADCDTGTIADAIAAAATSIEGETPGPLSEAARRMARAAQEDPAPRNPTAAEVVRDMASTFLSVTFAGESRMAGTVILMQEVARLADACAARAATATAQRDTQEARKLVHASLATLTAAADQQAAATLTTSTRGTGMSEPTHEDELLQTLTQAGVLAAHVARARISGSSVRGGTSAATDAEIARLRKAGYTERSPYDDLLRELLGEKRWAWYAQDKARVAAAAAVTDAGQAGIYDMKKLLTRAVTRRPWEDDSISPATSIAQILHYRLKTEAERKHPSVMMQPRVVPQSKPDFSRTPSDDSAPHPSSASGNASRTSGQREDQPREPMPVTPFDGKLKELLGAQRWEQYADDPRRRDVAKLLTEAAGTGRDMNKLLTEAVTMRDWEDDQRSPSRRVASVLHYRVTGLLNAEPENGKATAGTHHTETASSRGETASLPDDVAGLLSNSTAPTGSGPKSPSRDDPANQTSPPTRRYGRPSDGRDSR